MDRQPLMLNIGADGMITSLYNDFLIPLEGKKHIERASEVEFNSDIQKWVVQIMIGPFKNTCLLKTFENRKEAIEAEIEFFNESPKHLTN